MILEQTSAYLRVSATPALLELLADHGVQSGGLTKRWRPGTVLTIGRRTLLEPHCGFYTGDVLCSLGTFSYLASALKRSHYGLTISFGRYCSIGGQITVVSPRHPIESVSTSIFAYDRRHAITRGALGDEWAASRPVYGSEQKGAPVIGNDVWCGTSRIPSFSTMISL